MASVRAHVLDKLYGNVLPERPAGLNKEVEQVFDLLASTVVQRRGHQCILLGARATGKTLVVNTALRLLEREYPQQCIIVRINGLVHSDDKLALRDIAKQLDAAIENGDEEIEKTSMSQTLKSINSLFERAMTQGDDLAPELGSDPIVGLDADSDATAVEVNVEDQLDRMRIIFVVEELDRFAAVHQVLAYELLDLSQTSPFGVTVIGTSTRMNVIDLLEKRNRSRNTALSVVLPKPSSPSELQEIANTLLSVDDPELRERCPHEVVEWENFLQGLNLQEICEKVWWTSNSARHLATELVPHVLGVADLGNLMVPASSERLMSAYENVAELDWAILICAARALVKYNTDAVNLVIVLSEYYELAREIHSARFQGGMTGFRPWPPRAVRHAWERLCKQGLLVSSGQSHGSQEDLKMYTTELDLDDLRELLPRSFVFYTWTTLS